MCQPVQLAAQAQRIVPGPFKMPTLFLALVINLLKMDGNQQRSMGSNSLPGYGSVALGKRLSADPLLGVVGGRRRKTPGYPIVRP